MPDKYYLTTPLYYVNARPHIGHSYTEIAADTLARFNRLVGKEVLFLTGTDEHGQKIDKAAQAAGLPPQEFTDKISQTFRDLWKTLNIEYDDFIRTTEPRHVKAVQAVWNDLSKRGEIYKDTYTGFYCTPDESFFTDRQVLTENGQTVCPDCKRPVDKIEEENFFLKISEYQTWLIDTVKGNLMRVLPETRKNEVLGFLENNVLQDLCISRPKNRLAWGIQSPLSETHVTYVWFDALINYITACGYGADEKKFKKWWPADVHIIGKDILRQHAIYWPIILHALGVEVPKMIFAHGWWVQGGEKMSKSRGNVVDPVEIVKTYGVDPYRYFLLSEAPFGQDGTFSEEALIERYNTALANDLGNLLHRSLTMCEKYFGGNIPQGDIFEPYRLPHKQGEGIEESSIRQMKEDHVRREIPVGRAQDLMRKVDGFKGKLTPLLDRLAFSEALDEIWIVVNIANKFIEESTPWKLSKEGKEEDLKLVIRTLMEVLKATAQAVWPFIPTTGEAVWRQLGITKPITEEVFKENMWGYFEKGGKIQKGAPLFPRIEIEKEGSKEKK